MAIDTINRHGSGTTLFLNTHVAATNLLFTVLKVVLIDLPSPPIIAMDTMAIKTRISAYSTMPCPFLLRNHFLKLFIFVSSFRETQTSLDAKVLNIKPKSDMRFLNITANNPASLCISYNKAY